jgi:hypothetical protein
MRLSRPSLLLGLTISLGVLGRLNYRDLRREPTCADCFAPHGVPFTLFREGGFAGGSGIVWTGVTLDLLVGLAAGVGVAFILHLVWPLLQPYRGPQ